MHTSTQSCMAVNCHLVYLTNAQICLHNPALASFGTLMTRMSLHQYDITYSVIACGTFFFPNQNKESSEKTGIPDVTLLMDDTASTSPSMTVFPNGSPIMESTGRQGGEPIIIITYHPHSRHIGTCPFVWRARGKRLCLLIPGLYLRPSGRVLYKYCRPFARRLQV